MAGVKLEKVRTYPKVTRTRLEKLANLIALEIIFDKTDLSDAITSLENKGYDRFELYEAYTAHGLPTDPTLSY